MEGVPRVASLCAVVALITGACGPSNLAANRAWESEGVIQVMDGQTWVVGDRLITIAPGAEVAELPAVGARVRVIGSRTEHGKVLAERVQVLEPAAAEATVTPTSPRIVEATPSARTLLQMQPPVQESPAIQDKPPVQVKPPARGREQVQRPKPRDREEDEDDD
jgi:hypothetical protein